MYIFSALVFVLFSIAFTQNNQFNNKNAYFLIGIFK